MRGVLFGLQSLRVQEILRSGKFHPLGGREAMTNGINVMRKFALVCALAIGSINVTSAEGRCPPGQYPVGDDRAGGCAPIPGSGGNQSAAPASTGRWIKTWGAIALSPNGASGTVTGKVRKAEASNAAVAQCSAAGGTDCRVSFTYKNQCAAAVIANGGLTGTKFGSAATEQAAGGIALHDCRSAGGVGCEVICASCTEPYFERF
jgi:hypothetical protein